MPVRQQHLQPFKQFKDNLLSQGFQLRIGGLGGLQKEAQNTTLDFSLESWVSKSHQEWPLGIMVQTEGMSGVEAQTFHPPSSSTSENFSWRNDHKRVYTNMCREGQ